MEKLYIIKIGGSVIDDEKALERFIISFSAIEGKKVLVHGGGKFVDALAEKLGVKQQMVNGRRITDAETLKLTAMVYAGLLNKQLVASLQNNGVNALGLSGADGNVITAVKRNITEHDFGFVGDVEARDINTTFISLLLNSNIVPVFCSLTHDGGGQLLNTNADTLASSIAVAMAKEYTVQLNYCFEKKGVLRDVADENSLIPVVSATNYKSLLAQGVVSKGMIPKLDNAFNAIKNGVETVVIAHADELVNTVNKKENAGTYLVA